MYTQTLQFKVLSQLDGHHHYDNLTYSQNPRHECRRIEIGYQVEFLPLMSARQKTDQKTASMLQSKEQPQLLAVYNNWTVLDWWVD